MDLPKNQKLIKIKAKLKIMKYLQKQPPEKFCKFTGKHMHQSLFFNKVSGLRPATLFKLRLWHRCFPVNFAKFFVTPVLQKTICTIWQGISQPAITCSKLTIETLEQGVKYVQS